MSICANTVELSDFSDLSNKTINCLNTNQDGIDDLDLVSSQTFVLVCSLVSLVCFCFMISSIVLYIELYRTNIFKKSNITSDTSKREWGFNDDMLDKLIPIHKINKNYVIGRGEFSNVYFGQVPTNALPLLQLHSELNAANNTRRSDVAIKVPTLFVENMDATINEIHILKEIGHHLNVVEFHGFALGNFSRKEIYIVTEFCENGSLLKYLRICDRDIEKGNKRTNEELLTLLRFTHEISVGMDYLNFKKIIYGDLAARNVFVDAALICKIGDFGLSVKDGLYNNVSKIPWKWRPPESMRYNIITKKSDVWSFGVTLWEIFSLGRVPYPGISFSELVTFLENNNRLEKPRYASQEIYETMLKCWKELPCQRPSFYELIKDVAELRTAYDLAIQQKTTETFQN